MRATARAALPAFSAILAATGSLACSNSGNVVAAVPETHDAGKEAATPDAPASLSELSVAPLTLVPAFSPDVHDYYVRCSKGTNALTVSMAASPGASTLLVQPSLSPSLRRQSLSLNVEENQAIVATATDAAGTSEYWIRCLPHDFPEMQWSTSSDAGTRTPGYYLVGLYDGESRYATVLDTNGVPVWYKYNASELYDVETLVSGTISFSNPWQIQQLSPWKTTYVAATESVVPGGNYLAASKALDEHELRVLPNGDYLGFMSPVQTGVDLTGLTIPLPDGGVYTYGPNGSITACDIVELNGAGAIVWKWIATDHFDPVKVMVVREPAAAVPVAGPFHCNAIDVDPANGNLLVSARAMSSVFYIEKSTGKVLWKMGGANSSKDGAIYVPVDDPFACQHDARLQPGWKETCSGGTGQISLFDDESYTTNPARAVLYDVTIRGASACGDGGAGGESKATRVWQYKTWKNVPSNVTGSFRISADGSRTIGWGQSDPPNPTVEAPQSPNGLVFTEVDVQGNDLLDLISPDRGSSYRVVKVALGAFDLNVLRSTSGLP